MIPNTIVTMEQELRNKEQDVCMELENATINLQDGFLSEFAQDEEKKTSLSESFTKTKGS